MRSGFMSILLPGELLKILDMCEENRQWNVWTSEQKANTKKQKGKTKDYTYQACKRRPRNKRFAGFLIMSNFLQSSGPRIPTVRLSRCSSVPSLCTSTRETQHECTPCHQDFRNKRSSVIISPLRKRIRRKEEFVSSTSSSRSNTRMKRRRGRTSSSSSSTTRPPRIALPSRHVQTLPKP